MIIKVIQTRYKGYCFRSRLEARWAVFFDALGVRWEYEKEGYELPSGRYLPDFWLSSMQGPSRPYPEGNPPVVGWWVEIKPSVLSAEEESRCLELSRGSGHVVYALAGSVGAEDFLSYKWHPKAGGGLKERYKDSDDRRVFDDFYCDTFLFYLCSHVAPLRSDGYWIGRQELDVAFQAARSARFEHGETPGVSR